MENLTIKSVLVQDFGGLKDSFKFELGQVAVVIGANGAGKTSFLQAIHSVLEGGHDPEYIHKDAAKAKVIIELSNGAKITKTITPKDSTLEVLSPDGGVVKGPATYIKGLVPALSFDPVQFLASDPKERAAFLLRALPMNFDAREVGAIVGTPISGSVDLTRFNEIRDGQFSQRSEVNRQQRDLDGTIRDMEKSLPADEATDWGVKRDELAASIADLDSRIRSAAAEIELEAEQARSAQRTLTAEKIAALKQQISGEESALATFLAKVDQSAASAVAESTREMEAEKIVLSASLGEARAKSDQQKKAEGIRQAIAGRKEVHAENISKELRLNKVLAGLDALKHRKLKDLPIDGLDLKTDTKGRPIILINGIPLDKLNRQTQLFVAIQAVSKAGGAMPLIICECAEIDDRHLADLVEAGKEAGIQMILARWKTGAPLEVQAA